MPLRPSMAISKPTFLTSLVLLPLKYCRASTIYIMVAISAAPRPRLEKYSSPISLSSSSASGSASMVSTVDSSDDGGADGSAARVKYAESPRYLLAGTNEASTNMTNLSDSNVRTIFDQHRLLSSIEYWDLRSSY